MVRWLLFLSIIAFTGCFNGNNSETEGLCGTVDTRPSEILLVETPHIFKAKCATCHSYDKDLTGPKMNGILDRVPSEEWLRTFITNQDSLIAVNDSVAIKIMDWSPVKWSHNYSDMEKRDLDTLMLYVTQ